MARPRHALPPVRTLVVLAMCASLAAGCWRPASRGPNPANELPFGILDEPRDHQTVGRTVTASGWALDDTGVAAVNIYTDGKYSATATVSLSRPDVSKAYPAYVKRDTPNIDIHGWRTTVDVGERPGPHTILAQAVDDSGATRDLGSVVVTLIGRP